MDVSMCINTSVYIQKHMDKYFVDGGCQVGEHTCTNWVFGERINLVLIWWYREAGGMPDRKIALRAYEHLLGDS